MAMNTPYLVANTSSQSNINSPYILDGLTGITSDLSSVQTEWVQKLIVGTGGINSASALSVGAITGTTGFLSSTLSVNGAATLGSTLSVGGLTTFTSSVTVDGFLNLNSQRTQAGLLSYQTTASAASTILPDGALGVYFLSVTSMALAFRSGVTTYTIRATAASVL